MPREKVDVGNAESVKKTQLIFSKANDFPGVKSWRRAEFLLPSPPIMPRPDSRRKKGVDKGRQETKPRPSRLAGKKGGKK